MKDYRKKKKRWNSKSKDQKSKYKFYLRLNEKRYTKKMIKRSLRNLKKKINYENKRKIRNFRKCEQKF